MSDMVLLEESEVDSIKNNMKNGATRITNQVKCKHFFCKGMSWVQGSELEFLCVFLSVALH